MSRMSDLDLEIQELVVDAISTPGLLYDTQILQYVNDRCSVEVNLETIEGILDRFFGEDFWENGVVLQ
ncbi:hypothetical protein EB001_19960 [bacterium]|jgi:hypothetical protein|nr:hypothetical protein [bacterium]